MHNSSYRNKYLKYKNKYITLKYGGNKQQIEEKCSKNNYKNYNTNIIVKLPEKKKIIVFGDIHGDYKLALTYLRIAKLINTDDNNIIWQGKDTYVVQLGDQIDSCRSIIENCNDYIPPKEKYIDTPDDIKILKLFTDLDKQARAVGGMVISLLGNHEIRNLEGDFSYVSKSNMEEFNNYDKETFSSLEDARKDAFGPHGEYGILLGCTRLPFVIIGRILFMHAGITEKNKIESRNDLEAISTEVIDWILGLTDNEKLPNEIMDLFETRELSGNSNEEKMVKNIPANTSQDNEKCQKIISTVFKKLDIDKLVIGHTPQYKYNNSINSTCSGKIWLIDTGSAKGFNIFDEFYKTRYNYNMKELRKPKVLEIQNDIFTVLE